MRGVGGRRAPGRGAEGAPEAYRRRVNRELTKIVKVQGREAVALGPSLGCRPNLCTSAPTNPESGARERNSVREDRQHYLRRFPRFTNSGVEANPTTCVFAVGNLCGMRTDCARLVDNLSEVVPSRRARHTRPRRDGRRARSLGCHGSSVARPARTHEEFAPFAGTLEQCVVWNVQPKNGAVATSS